MKFIRPVMMLSVFFWLVLPVHSTQVLPLTYVGVIKEIQGSVRIENATGDKRVAEIENRFYEGEILVTSRRSLLKVEIEDGTLFTLGPKSRIEVDQFKYEKQTSKGELVAKVQGIFRFKTGDLVKKKPDQMKVVLPTALIAVRGTQVAGEAKKKKALIVLEQEKEAPQKKGHVVVSNEVKGELKQVHITEFGFGTTVKKGKAPTPTEKVSAKELSRLEKGLEPTQDQGEDSEGFFGAYDTMKRGVKGIFKQKDAPDAKDTMTEPPPEKKSDGGNHYH